jgi:DNA-directed RNA polymerase specialized sigma24 family protein
LRHFEGLSNAEIARITESTVPAVRSHLFRGRRTLSGLARKFVGCQVQAVGSLR